MLKTPRNSAIPTARGWPVVGSSIALLRDPLGYMRRQYAALGPVFHVRAMHRQFAVLAGTEANRFIAVEGRDCFESGSFWGRLAKNRQCPHFMIAMDGADHKTLRGVYRDDLSRRIVAEQAEGVAAIAIDELENAGSGEIVVRDLMRRLVSRQVHHMLTRGAPAIDASTAHALMELFRWDSNILLLGKWPRLALKAPQYQRYNRLARTFLDQLIGDTKRSMPEGWFGNTHRASLERPDLFTHGDTRMAFLLPFVAGVDTVGSTLAFLFYELLRAPSLHARVVAAVDQCYRAAGDRAPTLAELRDIPELLGLVLETLRLYPTAFGLYRRTTRAFEFAGVEIAAGRDALVFTTSPHTDPRYFPGPYRFDIDRYAPPRSEHKQRYVFAPYGGGPHICLGAGMGEALLILTAATLLHHGGIRATHPRRTFKALFDPSLAISNRFTISYRARATGKARSSPT